MKCRLITAAGVALAFLAGAVTASAVTQDSESCDLSEVSVWRADGQQLFFAFDGTARVTTSANTWLLLDEPHNVWVRESGEPVSTERGAWVPGQLWCGIGDPAE
ncbi:hypothetical protein GCM10012275_64590 [Longimycelium tulufanense]|uniref:Secreted protein n=1 Tax=Longimycelium tulufanense TaxID=907463 RepID=A0A8J3CLT9_9PSEU|nr:hypothetical protein GCM10012275_64590 [Longimycelium tulufanense]